MIRGDFTQQFNGYWVREYVPRCRDYDLLKEEKPQVSTADEGS